MQLAIRCLWPPQTSEEYPTFLPLPIPANLLYIRHAASKITEGSDWLRAHRCQSRQRETCSCQSAACNFPGKGECGLWEGLNNDAVPAPCQERRATPPRPSCSLLPLHKAPDRGSSFHSLKLTGLIFFPIFPISLMLLREFPTFEASDDARLVQVPLTRSCADDLAFAAMKSTLPAMSFLQLKRISMCRVPSSLISTS